MNNELMNANATNTIESREVAEMIDMKHYNLTKKIRGYIKVLDGEKLRSHQEKSTNSKLNSLDFFIPSTYQDAKNETRDCYLLTKQGCEMVANKLTGEKGVLFTAKYVERFNEMEKQTATSNLSPQLQVLIAHEERMNNIENELQKLHEKMDTISASQARTIGKRIGQVATRIDDEAIGTYINRKYVLWRIRFDALNSVGARTYREVKQKDYAKVLQYIDEFKFTKEMWHDMMVKYGFAPYMNKIRTPMGGLQM